MFLFCKPYTGIELFGSLEYVYTIESAILDELCSIPMTAKASPFTNHIASQTHSCSVAYQEPTHNTTQYLPTSRPCSTDRFAPVTLKRKLHRRTTSVRRDSLQKPFLLSLLEAVSESESEESTYQSTKTPYQEKPPVAYVL